MYVFPDVIVLLSCKEGPWAGALSACNGSPRARAATTTDSDDAVINALALSIPPWILDLFLISHFHALFFV